MFLGSFTHENNFIDKSFGTTFINGNTVVIEYYEPNNTEFVSEIHINKVVHVFQDVNSGPFASTASASCNLNSTCSIGYGWERERKSVAVVLAEYKDYFKPSHSNMDYYGFGTGTLLNNVKQDGAAYFLTANHLRELDEIGNPILQLNKYPINDIYHWLFLFNYQSTSCDDKGSGFSSSTLKSLYASRVLSSDEYHSPLSDYLLLELNADAATLKDYNVCYAGWDIDDVHAIFSKFTVCIHHPQGDIMKMSKDHDPPVSGTCLNATYDTHWVVSWDEGITEQGSSGSPLFNDNHKLIGHLHAGSSDCAHPQYPDFFGKFSDSYFYGNFATWLDPDNTRSTSVGPYNPNTIGSCEHCYNGIPDGDETGIDCGGKDCPPCTWMNTYGWASNPLSHNGIKDEAQGEIGIDCGGPNCKPCGGDALCSDGIKDGDETDVDCGGSCIPCNVYCQGQVIYWGLGLNPVTVITTPLTAPGFDSHPAHIASDTGIPDPNNASLLPAYTSTSNFIEASNSHVNSGEIVTFKSAGKIKLKTGFSAKIGSTFKAKYTTCEKCK
ncbi:MAG: 3-coathanger stack domain-containing protein, partial [Paludibacter sp.]